MPPARVRLARGAHHGKPTQGPPGSCCSRTPSKGKGRGVCRKRRPGPRGTYSQRSSARPLGGGALNRAHGCSVQTASRENLQGLQGARTAKSSSPRDSNQGRHQCMKMEPTSAEQRVPQDAHLLVCTRRGRSCRAAVSILTSVRVRLARGAHNGSGLTESAQGRPPGSNNTARGKPKPPARTPPTRASGPPGR